jgi:hypothetical protein
MRVSLDVKNADEAEALRRVWADPEQRALVLVIGYLLPLSDNGRRRVLRFMEDVNAEQRMITDELEKVRGNGTA